MEKRFLLALLLSSLVLNTACAIQNSNEQHASSSSGEASNESSMSSEASTDVGEVMMPVTYVEGVCASEIPSTWQVRSVADQAIWNREANTEPPSVLTADYIMQRLNEGLSTTFKPAIFSMADSDTYLPGHSEDPGAEDSNRNEVDILRLTAEEMEKLLLALETPPESYAWENKEVSGHTVLVLRDITVGQKYSGQEFVFVPADMFGRDIGIIISNRSNDGEWNKDFRAGVEHFLSTMNFEFCPKEW